MEYGPLALRLRYRLDEAGSWRRPLAVEEPAVRRPPPFRPLIPSPTLAVPRPVLGSDSIPWLAQADRCSSHGRSGMKRWMLGSVAEKVAPSAEVPVLIVRREANCQQRPSPLIGGDGALNPMLEPVGGERSNLTRDLGPVVEQHEGWDALHAEPAGEGRFLVGVDFDDP